MNAIILTMSLLFARVPLPAPLDAPTMIAEDQQGKVYLLLDTKPRTILVWDGKAMKKVSPASYKGVTLIRAGRETLPLASPQFPGQMTRDQHVNRWRLLADPQHPNVFSVQVCPPGTDAWQTPLVTAVAQPDAYQTIVADEVGYVWISTPNGVISLDARNPTVSWSWTSPQPVTALGLSPNGRALAGLADGTLYELGRVKKGQGAARQYTAQPLPSKPIRAIHTDGEGNVWVVVGNELYRATAPADAWQRNWKLLARMPVSNHDIFSGVLDNKLYIFGGMGNYGYPAVYTYFNDLFVYDVRANRWDVVSQLEPRRAYNGCAALDGRIWVIGGRLLAKTPIPIDRVDIYDPKTSKWQTGPSLPTPRTEAVVVPVHNRIYVIGGTSSAPEPTTYDTLSIGTGETTWRVEPPIPGGTIIQASGCAIGGKIYLVAPQQKSAFRYDTVTRTWEPLPALPAEMTLYAAVCGAHNGEFWVMGGNSDKRLTFIYSPKTNSWRSGPDLPTPMGWTSAQDVNGKLIITPAGLSSPMLDDFIFTDTLYELR